MSRALRVVVAGVLAAGGGLVTASAASGLTTCPDDGHGYVPGGACQMVVEVEAGCVGDGPVLVYRASVEGVEARTLTLTWRGPQEHVGMMWDELPLEGAVPWPGDDGEVTFVSEPGGLLAVTGLPQGVECAGTGEVPTGPVPDVTIEPERPTWETPAPEEPGDQPDTDEDKVGSPGAPVPASPPGGAVAAPGAGGEVPLQANGGEVPVLANTGLSTVPLVGAAIGLLLGGASALVVGRRRRRLH